MDLHVDPVIMAQVVALAVGAAPGRDLPRPPGRLEFAGHYFYTIEDLLYEL